MGYILIVLYATGQLFPGLSITKFDSKASCERAAAEIVKIDEEFKTVVLRQKPVCKEVGK